jgi:hypothetical protein
MSMSLKLHHKFISFMGSFQICAQHSCLNNAHNINVQIIKWMNDIHVYSIQTYEKQILHDYYCQIVPHEVCDVVSIRHISLSLFHVLCHLNQVYFTIGLEVCASFGFVSLRSNHLHLVLMP